MEQGFVELLIQFLVELTKAAIKAAFAWVARNKGTKLK